MKKKLVLLIGVVVLFAAAGCSKNKEVESNSDEKASSAKNELVVAIANEPASLDPQNSGVVSSYQVQEMLFNTLITKDEKGKFHPSLAKSWKQIDDTTIRFKLRDDVTFHNGEKLTAEDVRYTIQRATELPLSASIFTAFDGVNTKVIDDLTVDIKTKEPFAGAMNYLATPSRANIVSKKAVEEEGLDGFGISPVGTGPFKFKKWISGDRIVLERNDDFFGKKATYKTYIARIIPDASVRSMELESGGVDFLYNVNPADYDRLKENKDIKILTGTGYTHEIWQFSMQADEFSDIRVRQAFAFALDIPAIVKTVYGELGTPADSVFSDKVFGHVSIGPLKQNVKKAKQLLKEAGYGDGFKTEITFGESATTQAMLEIAQQMWSEVGIEVKITSLDQATYKDNNAAGITRFGRSNFTASSGDPDHALANWQSGYKGAFNANDSHIDELMAKGRAELDEKKRKAIYAELQEYCWNTYYSIPVVFPKVSYAYSSKITNFKFDSTEQPDLAYLKFSK